MVLSACLNDSGHSEVANLAYLLKRALAPRVSPHSHCSRMKLLPFLALCTLAAGTFAADKDSGLPADYQLLYQQDFASADALKDFVFTDASAWKVSEGDGKQ